MPDVNGIPYVDSTDLVSGWPATSQSVAQEVSDQLAEKLPYSYGTATPSTSDDGFLWYDSNNSPPTPKFWDGAAFQALTSGKILQIVRATDSTDRSTTSTSYVDVTGMSVTITPTQATSAVILISTFTAQTNITSQDGSFAITDASNNEISGANSAVLADDATRSPVVLIGYSTPATTSSTTYKMRFKVVGSGTLTILNSTNSTGQMYALEIGA